MEKKQTAVEWLKKLFKQKSVCCKEKMNSVDIHLFSDGSESLIYKCSKCQKLWI
jgi:hypothetical protein